MKPKRHHKPEQYQPGDWLWIIDVDRFVAMTPEAYAVALHLADVETPDAWEDLRSRGGTRGQLIRAALDVLVGSGTLRIEQREIVGGEGRCTAVYAIAPPEHAAQVQQQRDRLAAKRARRKRAPAAPPELVLVQGGAAE